MNLQLLLGDELNTAVLKYGIIMVSIYLYSKYFILQKNDADCRAHAKILSQLQRDKRLYKSLRELQSDRN